MAFQIPMDQIRDLQILLRKEANLSWYQPENDTSHDSLSKLPSVLDTIAELDPSPPELRCKNCKGRLLRGANSLFCFFCGSLPSKELPPEPIKFKNTVGYGWLLDSLHLHESDLASPLVEAHPSNRRKSETKNEIPLSELLDLKIRWSSESDSLADSISNGKLVWGKASISGGVDVDNFFSPRESANESSQEQLSPNKLDGNATSDTFPNAFGAAENLSLFENLHSYETPMVHTGESGGSSSIWEANFLSTNSRTIPQKSKLDYPFVGSSVDLTAHMDMVFGSGVDVKGKDEVNSSAAGANDWFQSGMCSGSNREISRLTEKPEKIHHLNEGTNQGRNDDSSNNFNCTQVDPWQNNKNNALELRNPGEGDNLFDDAWNDFTSLTTSFDSFHSTGGQTANQTSLTVERTAQINLFRSPNKSNDVGFEAFSDSDFISAPLNSPSTFVGLNRKQSESLSDRIPEMYPIIGNDETFRSQDMAGSKSESNEDENVKMLMLQMHDLSFMLESNLSIPPK